MKATDRRRVERLIAKWQPRLGLQEWDIHLLDTPPPAGDLANIDGRNDVKVAAVQLSPRVVGRPDEELTVVHELLHITPNFGVLNNYIENNQLLMNTMRPHLEGAVDDVARYLLRLEGRSP